MNLPQTDVKVKCKLCNNQVVASDFKLDPYVKFMVCNTCFRKQSNEKIAMLNKPKQDLPKQDNTCMHQNKPVFDLDKMDASSNIKVNHIDPNMKASDAAGKPAGWDKDDEILNRLYKSKQNEQGKEKAKFTPIDGNRLKYVCQNCSYKFTYDKMLKKPKVCPYCDRKVPDYF